MPLNKKPEILVSIAGVIIFCLLFPFTLQAQDIKTLTKADTYYKGKKYNQAIRHYLKVIEQDASNTYAIWQVARCYNQSENYEAAENFYQEIIIRSKEVDPLVFLEYGELLMKTNRYSEARNYFMSYNNMLEKNDLRALQYISSIEDYDHFFTDSSFCNLKRMLVSTNGEDLSPALYNGILYFETNNGYLTENPLLFDINYTQPPYDNKQADKLKSASVKKNRQSGFAIASATGEILQSVTNSDDLSAVFYLVRSFIGDDGLHVSKPERVSVESFNGNITYPSLNSAGDLLVFSSDDPDGAGGWDLYLAHRNAYGYSKPDRIGGFVNTLGDEKYPCLINDSLLIFSSDGHGGLGGFDIFYYNLNKPTSLPENLGYPLNSSFDDFGLIMADDLKSGYLCSNRAPENSYTDLYSFEIEFIRAIGEITDLISGENLKNVYVDLKKNAQESSQSMLADNGYFEIIAEPEDEYSLSVWCDDYSPGSFNISLKDAVANGFFNFYLGKFPVLKIGESTPAPFFEAESIPESVTELISPVEDKKLIEEQPRMPEPVPEYIAVKEEIEVTEKEITVSQLIEPVEEKQAAIDMKADMKEVPVVSADVNIFRLQIAASRVKLNDQEIKAIYSGEREVYMFTEDNWYKYAIGDFSSFYDANAVRKKCGVKGAFIAAYQNGLKTPLMPAIKQHNEYVLKENIDQLSSLNSRQIIRTEMIYFLFDSYTPASDELNKLDKLIQLIKEDDQVKVEINGHTDKLGSSVYNTGLAAERASFIRDYIISKGVSDKRISIQSFGERKLIQVCHEDCTVSDHQQNRRAEILLYR